LGAPIFVPLPINRHGASAGKAVTGRRLKYAVSIGNLNNTNRNRKLLSRTPITRRLLSLWKQPNRDNRKHLLHLSGFSALCMRTTSQSLESSTYWSLWGLTKKRPHDRTADRTVGRRRQCARTTVRPHRRPHSNAAEKFSYL